MTKKHMVGIFKLEWQTKYRAHRIAQRRADKAAERLAGWQAWAQGMALLRSILRDEAPRLLALADADEALAKVKRYE